MLFNLGIRYKFDRTSTPHTKSTPSTQIGTAMPGGQRHQSGLGWATSSNNILQVKNKKLCPRRRKKDAAYLNKVKNAAKERVITIYYNMFTFARGGTHYSQFRNYFIAPSFWFFMNIFMAGLTNKIPPPTMKTTRGLLLSIQPGVL